MVSPFPLSGWLRHGCERVIQVAGGTACHPGEANADYMLEDVYERDLDAGYHEKGSCVDGDAGCVLYDLFGGFNDRAGRLVRRPIRFSPIRRQVDVLQGEAEAHYRQLNTQVRSRNSEDDGQPLRMASRDVVGNLVGTWKLSLRELKPEYIGLLVEAVDYWTLTARSSNSNWVARGISGQAWSMRASSTRSTRMRRDQAGVQSRPRRDVGDGVQRRPVASRCASSS